MGARGGVEILKRLNDGRFERSEIVYPVELTSPQTIVLATADTVPCGAGMALAVHDRLVSCSIDRPATIQLNDLPAGATLWFRWDGTLEEARYVEGRNVQVVRFDESGDVLTDDASGRP